MLVYLVVLAILPLGLTIKGKLLISVSSFLFALGGLTSVLSFPLWQTGLMMVTLIFFTAYFIDKRMGTVMFKKYTNVFQEEWKEEYINPLSNSNYDFEQGDTSLELNELLQTDESSFVNLTPQVLTSRSQVIEQEDGRNENNLLDEDISFLLERETETEVVEQHEEEPEVGYLSEIQSLIDEEIVEKGEQINRDWLEELDDLLPLDEVAAARADFEEEKKISLQK